MKRSYFQLAPGIFAGIALLFISTSFLCAQTRTLRIAAYNIEDDINGAVYPLPGLIAPPGNTNNFAAGGALEGIGEENVAGDAAQPLDILALEETTGNSITVAPIVNALNIFYNKPGMYANSPYQATESGGDVADGNGPNAVVYNTLTVQLVASTPVDPSGGTSRLGSASGEYREAMRYEFAPAGVAPTAANEFYIYVSHYKSGGTLSDAASRAGEAAIIRTNEAIDLPASARVIYVGDYNMTDSVETAYQTILAPNSPNGKPQGQGIDPLNVTNNPNINWSTNTTAANILVMLTEDNYSLKYRDDLQTMTTNIYFGAPGGLQFVPGTYHAFANNGSVAYKGSVVSSTALNTDLSTDGPVFLTASTIYSDLTTASDHLPILADYTVPLPTPMIANVNPAGADLTFNIANAVTNAVYRVLMATNLPPSNWTPVATNTATGTNFTFTLINGFNSTGPQQFYLLATP
ncbi:MAG TPA: hypothetical protein VMH87_10895 [Pseudomonadales bacterium]|nr:hypothetical protein [Pseudomonadales bacterium]